MKDRGFIDFLKAGHGDAFILHCRKGDCQGIVVVDGGYCGNKRLNKFMEAVEDCNPIDLMILTHPDDDHLVGILKYIELHLKDEKFPVKEIWANCAPYVNISLDKDASPGKANCLSDILHGLHEKDDLEWKYEVMANQEAHPPFADIELVGPSKRTFEAFIKNFSAKTKTQVESRKDASARKYDTDLNTNMQELATRVKKECNYNDYNEVSNASSISFILRCDDFSILMLGDSYPEDIIEGLKYLGFSEENPLKVEYVKMSHHGSAMNINNTLMDMIDCQNFLIPTNGHIHRHPDREALANVLCHSKRNYGKTVHFYFNYPLDVVESAGKHIFNNDLDEPLNFEVHESGDGGAVLRVC